MPIRRYRIESSYRLFGVPIMATRSITFEPSSKTSGRKSKSNPEEPQYIMTEPWIGYRFNGSPRTGMSVLGALD